MRILSTVLVVVLLAGCGISEPETQAVERVPVEEYPGPWRTSGPVFDQIAMALGRNSVSGCGEFHYRYSRGNPDSGEALVYCTRDGRTWTHYLVFYKINRVMRVAPEDGVPNPTPILSPDP